MPEKKVPRNTSWERSDAWYDSIVGKEGHYYHQKIILPNALRLLELKRFAAPSLLDLGCGQGILARSLPSGVKYQGIDLSPSLIEAAKKLTSRPDTLFTLGDITQKLPLTEEHYTHAALILALQNVAQPAQALMNAARHLNVGGMLLLVLNHPSFRIPRQTHWGVDPTQNLQYRRVDSYLSALKIPIKTHPSQAQSATTWSFHHPLQDYCTWLVKAGFSIGLIEEWVSDKKSEGRKAKMEDKARAEFPLFLAIQAKKCSL